MKLNRLSRLVFVGLGLALAASPAATASAPAPLPPADDAIDHGLDEILRTTAPEEIVSSILFLWDQGDVPELARELDEARATRAHRSEEVLRRLRDTAAVTQRELQRELDELWRAGRVESFESFWLINGFRVDATAEVLRELALHPDVMRIYYNLPIEGTTILPEDAAAAQNAAAGQLAGGVEIGLEMIQVPAVWDLGYTGEGMLVASLDTGVAGTHPAVASRWRGNDPAYANNPEWAWFDPVTGTTFPQEFDTFGSHGTHTMGTMVGGAPGDAVGVAPDAEWIHAAVIDRGGLNQTITDAIAAFEWLVDPDGNPATSADVPVVCNNSWGVPLTAVFPQCADMFWSFIDNAEAAGVLMLFAAGNESTQGLRIPASRATTPYQTVAIGAVDANNPNLPLGSFSAQGPTACTPDGSTAIKPDLSAPGVQVRSAVGSSGYASYNGTSMASPHVAGVVALMHQACGDLGVDQIKQILYDTAIPLGAPGKNNQYGWGMVDAYEAVLAAEAACVFTIAASEVPGQLDPGEDRSFTVSMTPGQEKIVPGTEELRYRYHGESEFLIVPLIAEGDGVYTATLPAPDCSSEPEFYLRAEGDGGSVRTLPANAPKVTFTAFVGWIETVQMYAENLDEGLPADWAATGLWNVTSACAVSGECQEGLWAYYGQPNSCHYSTGFFTGNSGQLTSAPLTLPEVGPNGSIAISFCQNLEMGSFGSNSASFSLLGTSAPATAFNNTATWASHQQDVTAHAGQSVQLRWSMNTAPTFFSTFRGWQINNIEITTSELVCKDVDPPLPGADINGDGQVDVFDLLILLDAWGLCPGADPIECPADLNGDGVVDVFDLMSLLEEWG